MGGMKTPSAVQHQCIDTEGILHVMPCMHGFVPDWPFAGSFLVESYYHFKARK